MKHFDIEKGEHEAEKPKPNEKEEPKEPKKIDEPKKSEEPPKEQPQEPAQIASYKHEFRSHEFKSEKPSKRGSVWPYILGVVLGFGIVFAILQIQGMGIKKEEPKKEETKSEETATTESTDTTTPSAETNKEETTTPTETKPETAAETIDKAKISIQVLNGNGIAGDAAKVKATLEKDGWTVKNVGNANSFKYDNTLVYYKTGQEEAGKEVGDTLKSAGKQTGIQESKSLKAYDVQVVTGKK